MMHGELSNQAGYTIAFRCEDNLVKYKTGGIKNAVLNILIGKEKRAEIDEYYRSTMEHLYRNTEYCVDLVILREKYTDELKKLLEEMPYNRVVLIDKETQISQRLLMGDITIYVDDDGYRRSLINSVYAIPLRELNNFIRR